MSGVGYSDPHEALPYGGVTGAEPTPQFSNVERVGSLHPHPREGLTKTANSVYTGH
jgi:hypothetical protein